MIFLYGVIDRFIIDRKDNINNGNWRLNYGKVYYNF